jgi:hypothetical protein
MKRFSISALALGCIVDLTSCQFANYTPPPVTTEMARSTAGHEVNLATLRQGRALFVHRCIECHTLPAYWHYRTREWPQLVDSMGDRAQLKPAERDAIVAYILAARQ